MTTLGLKENHRNSKGKYRFGAVEMKEKYALERFED